MNESHDHNYASLLLLCIWCRFAACAWRLRSWLRSLSQHWWPCREVLTVWQGLLPSIILLTVKVQESRTVTITNHEISCRSDVHWPIPMSSLGNLTKVSLFGGNVWLTGRKGLSTQAAVKLLASTTRDLESTIESPVIGLHHSFFTLVLTMVFPKILDAVAWSHVYLDISITVLPCWLREVFRRGSIKLIEKRPKSRHWLVWKATILGLSSSHELTTVPRHGR